jgi:hypothetical protein
LTVATEGKNLAAILWFVAAALALVAFGIRAASGEMKWYLAAAAVFLAAMGFSALRKPSRPA